MTIRKTIENHLGRLGMWPDSATAIVSRLDDTMRGRWDDEATSYSPELIATLKLAAEAEAIRWIDANKPKHFARAAIEAGLAAKKH